MAVKTPVDYTGGLYFITCTCQDRLSLFEITNSYNAVYKWFDYLKLKGHFVKGYVVMANHLHVLIDFGKSIKSVNTIISNGKRFMTYTIIERLKEHNKTHVLHQLRKAVYVSDKDKGKIHRVFERSFDGKEITSQHFFMQKLSYIHNNPCSGEWKLAENPVEYVNSSARFYLTDE